MEALQRFAAGGVPGKDAVLIDPHSLLFNLQLEGVNRLVGDSRFPVFGGFTWEHVLNPVGTEVGGCMPLFIKQ